MPREQRNVYVQQMHISVFTIKFDEKFRNTRELLLLHVEQFKKSKREGTIPSPDPNRVKMVFYIIGSDKSDLENRYLTVRIQKSDP